MRVVGFLLRSAAPRLPMALILLLVAAPLVARADDEPARKGLGRLLGKAADRVKEEAMKRFDANGDGTLDDAERAAAMDALKKKGGEMQAQVQQFLLRRFDADKDGTLDETERKAAFDETMKQLDQNGPMVKNTVLGMVHRRFDTDGNGKLDDKELGAAREEVLKRIMQGIGESDAAAPPPGDPARRRTPAEAARKQDLLDRFDADGDGKLDDAERTKAREDLEKLLDDVSAAPAAK